MLGDIIERAYTLEELALVELGFAQQQPSLRHSGIELLLLEPLTVGGVSRSFGIGLGALLDAVALDGLLCLLHGLVEIPLSQFSRRLVADRVERNHLGEVVLVALLFLERAVDVG